MSVVGLCSKCGGEVVSLKYHSFRDMSPQMTPPKCSKCGATEKKNLPVIEMTEETNQQLLQE